MTAPLHRIVYSSGSGLVGGACGKAEVPNVRLTTDSSIGFCYSCEAGEAATITWYANDKIIGESVLKVDARAAAWMYPAFFLYVSGQHLRVDFSRDAPSC